MSKRELDFVVVGAGPAGLATAIHACLNGLSCVVLERRRAPLDKACGEGIMPPGVRTLHAMGIDAAGLLGSPIVGIRYIDGERVAAARFANGVGFGVRRLRLSEALLSRAEEVGADVRLGVHAGNVDVGDEGVRIMTKSGPVDGRYLVAADGLHSRLRRHFDLERTWRGRPRFGVRRHYALTPWSEHVEVYWADDVEAYVTPVGDQVGVAMLYPGDGRGFDDLIALFPRLRERVVAAEISSRDRGAGPFRQGVHRRFATRVALVGDAAGYLDAITGEGISLGLMSAEALVETVVAGELLSAYDTRYRQRSRQYYRLTELLLSIGARPRLRRRVVGMLARNPQLFTRMLQINMGEAPLRAVGLGGLARMASGLVRG